MASSGPVHIFNADGDESSRAHAEGGTAGSLGSVRIFSADGDECSRSHAEGGTAGSEGSVRIFNVDGDEPAEGECTSHQHLPDGLDQHLPDGLEFASEHARSEPDIL